MHQGNKYDRFDAAIFRAESNARYAQIAVQRTQYWARISMLAAAASISMGGAVLLWKLAT